MSRAHAMAWLVVAGMLLAGGPAAWAGKAPHLTRKQAGWRQAQCESCHDAAAMAKSHGGGAPPRAAECARCHGYNGAPHEAHAVAINPCGNCHATTGHLRAFKSPDDCISCHVHPESPQGR